jgi:sugar phosphate isomerase/epimerase
MQLSLVLSTHSTSFGALAFQGELERRIGFLASLGFDGVELAVRDPALLDAGALEGLLNLFGVHVPAIGTGQAYVEEGLSLSSPDADLRRGAVARIRAQIRLGHRLKAMVIVGLIRGTVAAAEDRQAARARLVESLKDCAEFAQQKGVRLAVEPINRYETSLLNTVEEALELVEEVGSSAVGLLYDTFHANIEEVSFEQSLAAAQPRLLHVHAADSNRRAPGLGHLDFPALVRLLGRLGYDAWVSGEILPWPDPESSARRFWEHMAPLVRTIDR